MTDLEALIRLLVENEVAFLLVGGVAATVHGAARLTDHADVVYRRTSDNPCLRHAPPGLPFRFDAETIQRGLNFTLTTRLGALDLPAGRPRDLEAVAELETLLEEQE